MTPHRDPRRWTARRFLPLTIIGGVTLLLFWRVVLCGAFLPLDIVAHLHPWRYSFERVPVLNPINSDIVRQIYPRRVVTNALVAAGAWPLWNPTILTGTPLLADGQLAVFYPPSLLFLLLPLRHAFGAYAMLNIALAGLGSYLCGRVLQLRRGSALVVAITFMLSGFVLTWLQFPEFSGASAMLPWCFWAVARAIEQASPPGRWLLAGAVLALPIVAQIQLAFYIVFGVGCLVLARLAARAAWTSRLRLTLGFGGALLIALALSAVQLWPQIELSARGQRVDLGFTPGSPELYATMLLRLVFPLLGGTPRAAPFAPDLLQVPQLYPGVLPLTLALAALLWNRHRDLPLFALLALGSFALALGTPLLTLFTLLIPPYRQFADHSRWFLLWGFAVAVLAGMGADALAARRNRAAAPSERRPWLRWLALGLGFALLAAWGLRHLALWTPASRYGHYITLVRQSAPGLELLLGLLSLLAALALALRRVPRPAAWAAVLLLVCGDLLWHNGSYNMAPAPDLFQPTDDHRAGLAALGVDAANDLLYPPTRQTAFLLQQPGPFRVLGGDYQAMPTNVLSAFGIEDIRGYQSLYLARYNRLTRLIDGKDFTQLGEGGNSFHAYFTTAFRQRRLLNMLNVVYLVFPPGSPNPPLYEPLELVQNNDEGRIYRNPEALPRAWLVHRVEVIPDDLAQLARLADTSFDPATTAIVPAALPALAPPRAPEADPVVRYAPNRAFVTATPAAPALLVLADAYTEDWQVTLDGQPATVIRANYALRGVWLPAGTHELVFTYRPRAFVLGGAISTAAASGLLGYAAWSVFRQARRRR